MIPDDTGNINHFMQVLITLLAAVETIFVCTTYFHHSSHLSHGDTNNIVLDFRVQARPKIPHIPQRCEAVGD
jgi:hypothetical protein